MDIATIAESILFTNMGYKTGERILFLADRIQPGEQLNDADRRRRQEVLELTEKLADHCNSFAAVKLVIYPATGCGGAEPPLDAWKAAFSEAAIEEFSKVIDFDALLEKRIQRQQLNILKDTISRYGEQIPNIVIALANYSTTHTSFRYLLTEFGGVRYASMPLFDPAMMQGPMLADWNKVKERCLKLIQALKGTSLITISAPNGTHLTMEIEEDLWEADTGLFHEPGDFGNLPAGESFTAPKHGTAQGKLVAEYGPTCKFTEPVTFHVEDGYCTKIEGSGPTVDRLRDMFKKMPQAQNVAELGIGTNEKASRADNILETEKILGTIHIAFGDNSSFGGPVKVSFHEDYIVFKPTLKATYQNGDEKIIIKDGEHLLI